MNDQIFEHACQRIAAHASEHRTLTARVVLHGGEPLLAGVPNLTRIARRIRETLRPLQPEITMQTNGVMLTESVVEALASEEIVIGVSLDGDRQANDRHRRYANGRSSFVAVHEGLVLLGARPQTFAGILCVVDIRNDPLVTYESLVAYAPPCIDFLLPHAHWDSPPARRNGKSAYGDWLCVVFDAWYSAPARQTRVRLFEELINLILGGQSRTEVIGLSPVATIVINTDGSYEQIDTLRATYPGAVNTGLNVLQNSLNEALVHPAIVQRQLGLAALAGECRACPLHRVCGGGYYPHRYGRGSGFDNPSVYCEDLKQLIGHVIVRVRADLGTQQRKLIERDTLAVRSGI